MASTGTSLSRSRRMERMKQARGQSTSSSSSAAAQRYQTAVKGGSNASVGSGYSNGSGSQQSGMSYQSGKNGGGGKGDSSSASFSHKVAYWTKKMGISSGSNVDESGSGNGHGGHGRGGGGKGYPPHQQQQQQQQYAGGVVPPADQQPPHKYQNHHHQQQQHHQHHLPTKGANPYRSNNSNSSRRGSSSNAEAMDETDDILYQSAAQGMQKMNVDSRDETDHHTIVTASTAAATHSYSIDDGSTVVSEHGTEIVMPPRTIGMSRSSRDAVHRTPYNAHSFKAGNQTFTVDTKYSLIRVIGSGAYGVVISALDSTDQSKVAIKMVPKAFHDEVDAKRILREIKLLKHFHHENIVGITDMMPPLARHVEDFHDVYIANELMETDLHRIIYSKQPLTIDHVQYFLYQILRALKYIHSANVLHRDLKPSNLLVNSNCDLKVCDFGLARGVLSDDEMMGERGSGSSLLLTEYVVTRWYRAPEIMLACHEYAKPVDVWSVGCIFAELIGRKPYFPGDDYIDQLTLITEKLGKLNEKDLDFVTSEKAKRFMRKLPDKPVPSLRRQFPGTPQDALDLLSRMLQIHPKKRISVEEALEHPFLEQLHSPEDEPTCPETFDFTFEEEKLHRVRLQELIWEEIGDFRPGCLPVPARRDGTRGGPGRTSRDHLSQRKIYRA